jgi:hypothetical protein
VTSKPGPSEDDASLICCGHAEQEKACLDIACRVKAGKSEKLSEVGAAAGRGQDRGGRGSGDRRRRVPVMAGGRRGGGRAVAGHPGGWLPPAGTASTAGGRKAGNPLGPYWPWASLRTDSQLHPAPTAMSFSYTKSLEATPVTAIPQMTHCAHRCDDHGGRAAAPAGKDAPGLGAALGADRVLPGRGRGGLAVEHKGELVDHGMLPCLRCG